MRSSCERKSMVSDQCEKANLIDFGQAKQLTNDLILRVCEVLLKT